MLTISELWNSTWEKDWSQALCHYWEIIEKRPREIKEIEKEMDSLDANQVEEHGPKEWYDFLHDKYFLWKYGQTEAMRENRETLQKSIETPGGLERLTSIKEKIFTFDRDDIREGLRIVSKISGISIVAGSGLLAVIFPRYYATIDKLLILAMKRIEEYRNDSMILSMNPSRVSEDDGVLLITMLRDKAKNLNAAFSTDNWTPRKKMQR